MKSMDVWSIPRDVHQHGFHAGYRGQEAADGKEGAQHGLSIAVGLVNSGRKPAPVRVDDHTGREWRAASGEEGTTPRPG